MGRMCRLRSWKPGWRGTTSSTPTTYHGNKKSKVYHAPGRRYYSCKNCTVSLNSKEEAARTVRVNNFETLASCI